MGGGASGAAENGAVKLWAMTVFRIRNRITASERMVKVEVTLRAAGLEHFVWFACGLACLSTDNLQLEADSPGGSVS
jgi:hypothetical protein